MKAGGHGFGVTLVTAATVFWSTAGLFVRLLHLDLWTMLAWRSAFAALALALVAGLQSRRKPGAIVGNLGWPGLVAIPIAVVSMGSYVVALKLTTVANVMVIYATVPFVATGVAFLWAGEKAKSRTLVASAISLIGIAVMAGSATRARDVEGDAVALLMTLTFGTQLVMARQYPTLNMAPVNAIAAAVCAILCWPLAVHIVPPPTQLAILALFGVTTTALAYVLFLTGGRYIPSSEAGLIGLLDVVLGPLWVWLAFGERPSQAALVGGGIVLASVLWYLSGAGRKKALPIS